jgi:5'-AMP-activated protein kinase regulatory beta subunit
MDSDAKEVALTGDFNEWNRKSHRMRKDGSGQWKKSLLLLPGQYEYKFFVDGQWLTDPKNQQTCPNGFGTLNNVIHVTSVKI